MDLALFVLQRRPVELAGLLDTTRRLVKARDLPSCSAWNSSWTAELVYLEPIDHEIGE
jgi:hypothetical protein